MQSQQFTYDQLTPLEQCIADFMLRSQEKNTRSKTTKKRSKELADA
jgi:hypothetical protein